MRKSLINRSLKTVGWILAGVGAVAVLLTALVAAPLTRPPPLASISDTARTVDRSTMPALEWFQARDGTTLVYRRYPARGSAVGRVAILVHGSSGSSASVHSLSDA
ncbi:MAG: alpha/beta hydrolase, partial [Bradyrhizobium sp.]